jgi:hypothetical protein
MTGRGVPIPFFPNPPQEYNQSYFSQLVRNFAVFAEQSRIPGPLRATSLTLTTDVGNVDTGILSYNILEDTLDLQHLNNVVQQIGFETFMRCKNDTGSTIPNGTVVGFAGVNAEIKVAPYLADATANELFFVGVTTFDMDDGVIGPVTLYGKVRGIDTTGGPESWAVGDILYVSPTTPGALTNLRPTAPDVVIVVAAVLKVDATEGEIMVRPTVPIGLDYGLFTSTVDQTLSATNTPVAITYNNTLLSNGVTLSNNSRLNVAEAGFYQIDVNVQLRSNSSSAKNFYVWLRRNGTTNEPDTTRIQTLTGNNQDTVVTVTYKLSLQASEYIEVMWAGNDTDMLLDAVTGLSFAPDAPSAIVSVTQTQL